MYEGTKHSTATDAIRRGVPLEQIQAALRHADEASTRVYAKLARGGAFDILRNPARVSHLYPAENRPENTSEINNLWRGGRDSNPQLGRPPSPVSGDFAPMIAPGRWSWAVPWIRWLTSCDPDRAT